MATCNLEMSNELIPYTTEEIKAMVKTIAQLRKEKKELLDKVCEWIEDNIYDYLYINRDFNEADYKNELIEDLIKAMKQ